VNRAEWLRFIAEDPAGSRFRAARPPHLDDHPKTLRLCRECEAEGRPPWVLATRRGWFNHKTTRHRPWTQKFRRAARGRRARGRQGGRA
jgi:hypothetical protein